MEGEVLSGMDAVITSAGQVLELTGTILTTITSNPVLSFILASSFVGIGIAVFGKLKRAVR